MHHNTRKEREQRQQISAGQRSIFFLASECVYVRVCVRVKWSSHRLCASLCESSLSVLNGVRRSMGSYWIERCYLTASLFPSQRGYVRHLVTNCLSLPLIHKREHRVSQTTTAKQNKNRNVAFQTAEKPTAFHLGLRLKIRFASLTLGPS